MIKHNYHTHTVWCKHSKITAEEAILLSIKAGLKTIGFSEHMYIPSNIGRYRFDAKEQEQEFIKEINQLKEKYKNKIRVLCGFECELTNDDGTDIIDYAVSKKDMPGVDYLLIGHHFYTDGNHALNTKPTMKTAKDWLKVLRKGWKTGAFQYLVHPDLFVNPYEGELDEPAKYLMEEITNLAVEENIPLGVNLNGFVTDKKYPSNEFWKIAKEKGAIGILELDAHKEDNFDKKWLIKLQEFVDELGIELIDELNI